MQSSGDVSPSTKRRNYRNLRMAPARGKVCDQCMLRFAPFTALSLWLFPRWGSQGVGEPLVPMGPSTSSPRTASRAAGVGATGRARPHGW